MKNNAPRSLLERLEAHHQAGYLSLHMPGHKENTALAPYLAQLGAQWDITELPGFDDLHDPQDILAQAMDRAAKLWGSRKSWLQVNGSTGGLLAAIRRPPAGGPGPGGPALPQGHLPRHRGLRAGAHLPPAPGGGGAGHRPAP